MRYTDNRDTDEMYAYHESAIEALRAENEKLRATIDEQNELIEAMTKRLDETRFAVKDTLRDVIELRRRLKGGQVDAHLGAVTE